MQVKPVSSEGYRALTISLTGGGPDDTEATVGAILRYCATGFWVILDWRLSCYKPLSMYGCTLNSDDVHSHIIPESPEERAFIKGLIHDHREDAHGGIHWSTYDNFLKGTNPIQGVLPWDTSAEEHRFVPPMLFSWKVARQALSEMQAFWKGYKGDPLKARQPNPFRQHSRTELVMAVTRWREVQGGVSVQA